MNTLKYKGYIGSVNYSEPDKVFFGKLEGIDDLVNYEGESVKEITDAFHEAVDDYLIFCEDQGVKPEKSYTGTFNVRIAPATHRDIANLAAEENISINAFVKKALAEAVANYTPEQKIIPKRYPTPSERHLATLNEPEETYGTTTTVEVTIPPMEIQEITIQPKSLKFYNTSLTLFKPDEKNETQKALVAAEEDAAEKAGKSGLLEAADENAEALLKGILEGNVGEREIVIKHSN